MFSLFKNKRIKKENINLDLAFNKERIADKTYNKENEYFYNKIKELGIQHTVLDGNRKNLDSELQYKIKLAQKTIIEAKLMIIKHAEFSDEQLEEIYKARDLLKKNNLL